MRFDIFAMSSSPAGLDFDSNEKSHYVNPADLQSDPEKFVEVPKVRQDAFGDEEFAEVKYKVLKWWYVCNSSKRAISILLTYILFRQCGLRM